MEHMFRRQASWPASSTLGRRSPAPQLQQASVPTIGQFRLSSPYRLTTPRRGPRNLRRRTQRPSSSGVLRTVEDDRRGHEVHRTQLRQLGVVLLQHGDDIGPCVAVTELAAHPARPGQSLRLVRDTTSARRSAWKNARSLTSMLGSSTGVGSAVPVIAGSEGDAAAAVPDSTGAATEIVVVTGAGLRTPRSLPSSAQPTMPTTDASSSTAIDSSTADGRPGASARWTPFWSSSSSRDHASWWAHSVGSPASATQAVSGSKS